MPRGEPPSRSSKHSVRGLAATSASADEVLRLLVVEDDKRYSERYARLLGEALGPLQLTLTDSLASAREALADRTFHVALVDLSLPDARSVEAVAALRSSAPGLAIVAMGDTPDDLTALRSLQAGAGEYVVKDGVDAVSLRRSVRCAIERRQSADRLAQLVHYDSLTGLANRDLFAEHLKKSLQRAKRKTTRLVLMLTDVDRFKEVNDGFGHAVGDQLLVAFGNRLQQCLREEDLVARIGGDEFAIVLGGVPN